MKLGIDFNQFRHSVLRREFKHLGFRQIYDRVDRLDPTTASDPVKRLALRACKTLPPLRQLILTFGGYTLFVCVK